MRTNSRKWPGERPLIRAASAKEMYFGTYTAPAPLMPEIGPSAAFYHMEEGVVLSFVLRFGELMP
ncbi:MAG: hypothetical protein EPO21_18460 [Chloroflexota bacterium]|nr:MAG: hypothetical protein EPO21_18460 [Chloroflexota bacterium]